MSSFVTDCISGDALIEDINDYIDAWHDSETDISLHEFLGMNEQEYALYLQDEAYIGFIIMAHKEGKDIYTIMESQISIAARSDSSSKAKRLERWLKDENLWD